MKSVNELCNGEFDVVFDLSLVRGQGYYTGTVFEVESIDFKGAIAGGGRYDNLIGKFKYQPTDMKDFDPAEEEMLGKYAKKKFNSDFIFVTHYPSKKRPFYTMDDPEDPEYTLSFDLLFRGLEITSGGQRVHDYNEQVEKMKRLGMDPEQFETYLMLHKYGAPPHGGLGLGLERLTMHLLGFKNVREATMFPRDINRVTP